MNVAELLEKRRQQWRQLERYVVQLETGGRKLSAEAATQFAALYRATCADLALAEAYQLPAATVAFLHRLVARAHNQLYQSRSFRFSTWGRILFVDVPRRLFHDNALRLAFVIFWGFFIGAVYLGATSPEFAVSLVGQDQLESVEQMYSQPLSTGRSFDTDASMMGFYVFNNAGIGLRCFAGGILLGIGGLIVLLFNALQLGTIFGHMTTVPQADNFFEFVTAHGPFELTAIVLSAAAGMRLGYGIVDTRGYSRLDSLRINGAEALPIALTAMLMFFIAAVIEGFVSPSPAPYWLKAGVACLSTAMLLFYFVVLGWPGQSATPTETDPWMNRKS